MNRTRILVIEDDPADALLLRTWLRGGNSRHRYELAAADCMAGALAELDAHIFDVVIADLSLPDSFGLMTVETLAPRVGEAALIVMSGNDDENAALAAVRAGAQDYLVKGHADEFLVRRAIDYAIERRGLQLELADSQARFRDFAQASCDWFWETDSELRFTYVSDTFEKVTGMSTARLMGHTRAELIDVTATPGWMEHLATVQAQKPFDDFEYRVAATEGERAPYFRVSGVPAFDRTGRFRGYRGVGRDITERKVLEDRIERMALFDPLTDLPNRSFFEDALQRAASLARRRGDAVGILYLDLDGFKAVNDRLGHAAGDALLRVVACRLRACVREEDVVARLGGDEFVVVTNDRLEHAARGSAELANRIIETLRQPIVLPQGGATIGTSVGVAIFPKCDERIEECVRKADAAMYEAKRAGKGCLAFAELTTA
jgi:diguanylate cyclase (GGDEF)-like protein/PAS domain S-box-containing protein